MKFSRIYWGLGLILALGLLVAAAPAMGQVAFTLTSAPLDVRGEGHTETVGQVTLTSITTGGTIPAGSSITVDYGATITNDPASSGGGENVTTSCGTAPAVTFSGSVLTLSYAGGSSCTIGTFISIQQVRVDVNGAGPPPEIDANLSTTGPAGVTFTNSTAKVGTVFNPSISVTANRAEEQSDEGALPTPIPILQCGPPTSLPTGESSCLGALCSNQVVLNIKEKFPAALTTLGDETLASTEEEAASVPSNGVKLLVTFSGVPAGLEIKATSPGEIESNSTNVSIDGSDTVGPKEAASTPSTITFLFDVDTSDTSNVGSVDIPFSFGDTNGDLANVPASITATVSLAPIQTTPNAAPPPLFKIVSFGANSVSAGTVVTVSQCVTDLLFPFVANTFGFDTGIAISNTSNDGSLFPVGGASPGTSGSCTVDLFPSSGGAAPTAGAVTSTTIGPIPAGASATFLMSTTPAFTAKQGYMIAACNFQNGHGFAFITNLGGLGSPPTLAQGYIALVIPNPAVIARSPGTAEGAFPPSGEQLMQ